jgi:hypothetical protein
MKETMSLKEKKKIGSTGKELVVLKSVILNIARCGKYSVKVVSSEQQLHSSQF